MALNIKKPNYIDSSLIKNDDNKKTYGELKSQNIEHPFVVFKDLLQSSWKIKNEDIKQGGIKQDNFNKKDNLRITIDSLKNKSLITYMDAPWGSGKTYFIESLIEWIKKDESDEKFLLSENESTLKINFIDAWEIYKSNNIEEVLKEIFKPDVTDDKFNSIIKNNVKEYIDGSSTLKKKAFKSRMMRYSFITASLLSLMPGKISNLIKGFKSLTNNSPKTISKQLKESALADLGKEYSDAHENILTKSVIEAIENENRENNNIVFIDNIERLSSENRLDVVNKVMNWANLSGTTFLFLTNFEKIKITKHYEEDFWNKISLHETFKLTNRWQTYVENYKRGKFDLSINGLEDLKDFILDLIPTFFSNNEDNMDIREIKKILDNWEGKETLTDPKELIISLLKEIIDKNLEGLDKYFLINHSITWLSENKWHLWENDGIDDEEENSNIPLINNKMFRIQSNFYDLFIDLVNDKIKFKNSDSLSIKTKDIPHFKTFNNFIDDTATNKFREVVESVFRTRNLTDKNNYLFKYYEFHQQNNEENEIKYFEFKYNNIKKIHIYNDIFK